MPVRTLCLSVAILTGAGGCGTVVAPPPHPGRLPVVEALLVGGSPAATVRITWADLEPIPGRPPEPISPADVRLTLTGSSGPPAALVPRSDSAGLFVAATAILAGQRYRLEGTIAGRAITATTRIPASFTVTRPAADIEAGATGIVEPFRWQAPGASVFAADHAVFGESQYHHTRDTVGDLRIIPIDPARSPALTIWAMNADAERYLYHLAAPQSNVIGGLGMLGGALAVKRAFRWP